MPLVMLDRQQRCIRCALPLEALETFDLQLDRRFDTVKCFEAHQRTEQIAGAKFDTGSFAESAPSPSHALAAVEQPLFSPSTKNQKIQKASKRLSIAYRNSQLPVGCFTESCCRDFDRNLIN